MQVYASVPFVMQQKKQVPFVMVFYFIWNM